MGGLCSDCWTLYLCYNCGQYSVNGFLGKPSQTRPSTKIPTLLPQLAAGWRKWALEHLMDGGLQSVSFGTRCNRVHYPSFHLYYPERLLGHTDAARLNGGRIPPPRRCYRRDLCSHSDVSIGFDRIVVSTLKRVFDSW